MKNSWILPAALSFALSLSAWGQTPTKQSTEKGSATSKTVEEIKKLESERSEAMVRGDISSLKRSTAEDFISIGRSGDVGNKARMLADLKSGELTYKSIKLDALTVHLYGNTAVLTGKRTVEGRHKGKEIKGQDRFIRVYVKIGGRWQAVSFQSTPLENP